MTQYYVTHFTPSNWRGYDNTAIGLSNIIVQKTGNKAGNTCEVEILTKNWAYDLWKTGSKVYLPDVGLIPLDIREPRKFRLLVEVNAEDQMDAAVMMLDELHIEHIVDPEDIYDSIEEV